MSLNQALLGEFDQEMANTRKTLERVPEGKWEWQPHAKSMTLGRLANHVAEIPGWAAVTIQQESLDLPETYQPQILTSRDEILTVFDKGVAEAREAIRGASDEELAKTWTLRMAGKDVFSLPRMGVLRGMIMNHMIHHRAQLGVYLRLNDIAVPAIYGPSADEPGM